MERPSLYCAGHMCDYPRRYRSKGGSSYWLNGHVMPICNNIQKVFTTGLYHFGSLIVLYFPNKTISRRHGFTVGKLWSRGYSLVWEFSKCPAHLKKYAQASRFVSIDLTYILLTLEANHSETSLELRGTYTTRNDWEVIA